MRPESMETGEDADQISTNDHDYKHIHYIAKSIGPPLLMNRFDYFSNLQILMLKHTGIMIF